MRIHLLQSGFSLLIWSLPLSLRSWWYKICFGIRWQQAKSRPLGSNEERKIALQQVDASMSGNPCKCKRFTQLDRKWLQKVFRQNMVKQPSLLSLMNLSRLNKSIQGTWIPCETREDCLTLFWRKTSCCYLEFNVAKHSNLLRNLNYTMKKPQSHASCKNAINAVRVRSAHVCSYYT